MDGHDRFEEVFFDGLLMIVYDILYSLPINPTTFSPVLVNKRWSEIYTHPLQIFIRGRFNNVLYRYPPSYYIVQQRREKKSVEKIVNSAGMTLQLESIRLDPTLDWDPNPDNMDETKTKFFQFLQHEILLHSLILSPSPTNHPFISNFINAIKASSPSYSTYCRSSFPVTTFLDIPDVCFLTQCFVGPTTYSLEHLVPSVDLSSEDIQKVFIACNQLHLIPKELLTPGSCEAAVKNDPTCFLSLPEQFQKQLINLTLGEFEKSATYRSHSPAGLQVLRRWLSDPTIIADSSIVSRIIALHPLLVSYVPNNQRTEEIWCKIVELYPRHFPGVPDSILSAKIITAVLSNREGCYSLEGLGSRSNHYLKCLDFDSILSKNGMSLKFVPHLDKTTYLCNVAVEQNGDAIIFVPKNLATKELAEAAVRQCGRAIKYVPSQLVTEELVLIAIDSFNRGKVPIDLDYIPKAFQTQKICHLVAKSGTLQKISEYFLTLDVCEDALKVNGNLLKHVPRNMITQQLCEIAVRNNGMALKFVPKKLQSDEMIRTAVEKNGAALQFVTDARRTEELCIIAVSNLGEIKLVPKIHRTLRVYSASLLNNVRNMAYVPEHLRQKVVDHMFQSQNRKK